MNIQVLMGLCLPSWMEILSLRGRSRSVRDCCLLTPVPVPDPDPDPLSPEDGDLTPPRPIAPSIGPHQMLILDTYIVRCLYKQ